MTVKELIEGLKQYPEDSDVLLSSDQEGNHHQYLRGYFADFYTPSDVNDYELELSEIDYEDDSELLKIQPRGKEKRCVVLCP